MRKHKTPSRRTIEISVARSCGLNGHRETFTRWLVQRRAASYAAMLDAFRGGEDARRAKVAAAAEDPGKASVAGRIAEHRAGGNWDGE